MKLKFGDELEIFKENIIVMGRQIDSKISYNNNGYEVVLGKEELNSVTPNYETSLLKCAMKQLEIDSNVYIPKGIVLNYKFGLKIDDEYKYINFGNYVVRSVEKNENTNSYNIICYDKILYSMIPYYKINVQYPVTIREYIKAICDELRIAFKNINDKFVNYDKIIPSELYLDNDGNDIGYTFRDVLDELAEVTASVICINEETDELEIRYINDTNDTIDEDFLKDINVNFGEKYGPINSIVLSRSAESDNVYLQDEESIEKNGLCELKIINNQIMNFNDRSDYLSEILNKLNGLEYYINSFSSTGITYYNLCDRYKTKIGENIYTCIMLNDEVKVTKGLTENVFTEMPKTSVTDYTKADKTDRRINQTTLIVDKVNGKIDAVVSQVDGQNSKISQMEQTVDGITTTVEELQKDIQEGGFVTETQMNSAIEQSAEGITSSVTKTVTEQVQGDITKAKNEAIDSANNSTDNKLKNYPTTTQMSSAISQSESSIKQNVSQQIKDSEGNVLKEVDGKLELYIEKGDTNDVISAFNLAVNQVTIKSDNFELNKNGDVIMKNGVIDMSDEGPLTSDERIKISGNTYKTRYKTDISSYSVSQSSKDDDWLYEETSNYRANQMRYEVDEYPLVVIDSGYYGGNDINDVYPSIDLFGKRANIALYPDVTSDSKSPGVMLKADGTIYCNNRNISYDSGWIKCTLNSGFSHNALASAGDLMYRRIGNFVYLKGSVSGFSTSNANCTNLPYGFRPSTRIDFYAAESGNYMAKFMIAAGGSISYLGGTRTTVATSQWFNLCTSFITDDDIPV